jgi:hypothetical protein
MGISIRGSATKRDRQMLNESFMRAVAAERALRRDEIAEVHRLRRWAPAPAPRRVRIHIPRPSWLRLAWRRAPRLPTIGEDALAR